MAINKWLLLVTLVCLVDLNSSVGLPGSRHAEDDSNKSPSSGLTRINLIKHEKTQPYPVTFHNWIFYGEVAIGTPPQKFRVVVDTGFPMLWDGARLIVGSNYLPSPINIPGVVQLVTSIDTVVIGNISISNQIFGELYIVEPSREYDSYLDFDGILGIGFYKQAVHRHMTNPFQTMIEQKLVDQPIYSVYMRPSEVQQSGGELIFGGIDHQYYEGEITYLPVVPDPLYGWHFKLDTVSVGNESFGCHNGCQAFVDTANGIINGPLRDVRRLNRRLGAYRIGRNYKWMFPSCNDIEKLPPVTFKIGGRDFVVRPEQYVYKYTVESNITYCVSGISGSGLIDGVSDYWSLGSMFIEGHYTIFDIGQQRIGFTDTKMN